MAASPLDSLLSSRFILMPRDRGKRLREAEGEIKEEASETTGRPSTAVTIPTLSATGRPSRSGKKKVVRGKKGPLSRKKI